MKTLFLLLLACALPLEVRAFDLGGKSDKPKKDKKQVPLLDRIFHKDKTDAPADRTDLVRTTWKGLELTMAVDPGQLKLSDTRQLKITITLTNKGKHFMQLDFPTAQRFEVLIKDAAGKMVEQWSEERNFAHEPGVLSINPGERLVYTALVATRDLAPETKYIVEGFFPNYDGLHVQKVITPIK